MCEKKIARRKVEELAEALVSVKKDFAYKLQRFDYLLEMIADENEHVSFLKRRITQLQEITEELEEKRGKLDENIESLTNIQAELRESSDRLVEQSARLRTEISYSEQALREIGQRIEYQKKIKEGLEIALGNIPAEEVHYLSKPVFSMGITPSVCDRLEARGILYIGDLIPLSEQHLIETWGVGPVTLEKIKTKMNENGVWFGMDVIRAAAVGSVGNSNQQHIESWKKAKSYKDFTRYSVRLFMSPFCWSSSSMPLTRPFLTIGAAYSATYTGVSSGG